MPKEAFSAASAARVLSAKMRAAAELIGGERSASGTAVSSATSASAPKYRKSASGEEQSIEYLDQ